MNHLNLARFDEAMLNIQRAERRAMRLMHPHLLHKAGKLREMLEGRIAFWLAYRGKEAQEQAFIAKRSHAQWKQSPHNYFPSYAVDICLVPTMVRVEEHPTDPGWPHIFDKTSPDALEAWADVEQAAIVVGLNRINVHGERDRPHLELPSWRDYLKERPS